MKDAAYFVSIGLNMGFRSFCWISLLRTVGCVGSRYCALLSVCATGVAVCSCTLLALLDLAAVHCCLGWISLLRTVGCVGSRYCALLSVLDLATAHCCLCWISLLRTVVSECRGCRCLFLCTVGCVESRYCALFSVYCALLSVCCALLSVCAPLNVKLRAVAVIKGRDSSTMFI
jgi:hypothetical protein